MLPNDNELLGGYDPHPEHPAMTRAKQEYGGCDEGANHWPPHVCTYHIRRREYFGMFSLSWVDNFAVYKYLQRSTAHISVVLLKPVKY